MNPLLPNVHLAVTMVLVVRRPVLDELGTRANNAKSPVQNTLISLSQMTKTILLLRGQILRPPPLIPTFSGPRIAAVVIETPLMILTISFNEGIKTTRPL